jgi:hypothetical protein
VIHQPLGRAVQHSRERVQFLVVRIDAAFLDVRERRLADDAFGQSRDMVLREFEQNALLQRSMVASQQKHE